MLKRYELSRWRTRRGITHEDLGPERGWFRYEISLGFFETREECYQVIARLTGKSIGDIRYEIEEYGFYYGKYYPTGYSGKYYPYEKPSPEWYNDEYHIYDSQES